MQLPFHPACRAPPASLAMLVPLLLAMLSVPTPVQAAIQSEAVCVPAFNWAQNTLQQSPCLVAAYMQAACVGSYDVVSIVGTGDVYSVPSANKSNVCFCSWSVYNLLAACVACQINTPYVPWDFFVQSCPATDLQNSTFFPPSISYSAATAVPYWATVDPTTAWTGGQFDPSQAQALAIQGHPDVTQANRPVVSSSSTSTPHKKAPIGAIAGGAVGGIVVVFVVILSIVYVVRRKRQLRAAAPQRPPLAHQPTSTMSYASTAPLHPVIGGLYLQGQATIATPTHIDGTPIVSPASEYSNPLGSSQYIVDPLVLSGPREDSLYSHGFDGREPSIRSIPVSATSGGALTMSVHHERSYSKDSTMTGLTVAPYNRASQASALTHDRKGSKDSAQTALTASTAVAPSAMFTTTARPGVRFNPPAYSPPPGPSQEDSTSSASAPSSSGPRRERRRRGNTITENDEDEYDDDAPPAFQAVRASLRLASEPEPDTFVGDGAGAGSSARPAPISEYPAEKQGFDAHA